MSNVHRVSDGRRRDDHRDDGRSIGFSDYGPDGATPVLWCHGGPGSRMGPAAVAPDAAAAGFRLVGIDRPGYGLSTPWPGRSIADWVPDGIAVADHLGIDRFVRGRRLDGRGLRARTRQRCVPTASSASSRVAALTDMQWEEGRE